MRMNYEDRKRLNQHKAELLVRTLRRMIDEPNEPHDHDLVEILVAILNHEDRRFY